MMKKKVYLDVHDTIDMAIYKEITNRCDVCKELTLSMHSLCRPCYFKLTKDDRKYTKDDAIEDIKGIWREANNWNPGL